MDPILKEGKNCWGILPAGRAAFLIDGAVFFDAFFQAAVRAEKSILIARWDIDSRVRLFPEDQREGIPSVLSAFLLFLVLRKRVGDAEHEKWEISTGSRGTDKVVQAQKNERGGDP